MDEKKAAPAPEQTAERDQELFASIQRGKQRKKRRRLIVTAAIIAVLALAIIFGVRAAKKKVSEAVGSMSAPTVTEAAVTTGSISTTVSGSGMLSDTDTKQIVLPKGVKLDEILVNAGETVRVDDASLHVGCDARLSIQRGSRAVRQADDGRLGAVLLLDGDDG